MEGTRRDSRLLHERERCPVWGGQPSCGKPMATALRSVMRTFGRTTVARRWIRASEIWGKCGVRVASLSWVRALRPLGAGAAWGSRGRRPPASQLLVLRGAPTFTCSFSTQTVVVAVGVAAFLSFGRTVRERPPSLEGQGRADFCRGRERPLSLSESCPLGVCGNFAQRRASFADGLTAHAGEHSPFAFPWEFRGVS